MQITGISRFCVKCTVQCITYQTHNGIPIGKPFFFCGRCRDESNCSCRNEPSQSQEWYKEVLLCGIYFSSTGAAIFIRTSEAYGSLLRPLVVFSTHMTQAATYSPLSTNQSHLLLEDHGLIGDWRPKNRPGDACDVISFVGLSGR